MSYFDAEDVFTEEFDPSGFVDGGILLLICNIIITATPRYWYNGKWRNAKSKREIIHVLGHDDIEYITLHTHHGPVISLVYWLPKDVTYDDDVLVESELITPIENVTTICSAYPMLAGVPCATQHNRIILHSLSSNALRGHNPVDMSIRWSNCTNARQFREFVRDVDSAFYTMVFADVNNNIGFVSSGRVPIRNSATKPDVYYEVGIPRPGTGGYDWDGEVPREQMPSVMNPRCGFVVAANNRIWVSCISVGLKIVQEGSTGSGE